MPYAIFLLRSLLFLVFWYFRSYLKPLFYWRISFVCCFILFSSMYLQIEGLHYTTAAKNGFITVLYALFTPMLTLLFYRARHGLLFRHCFLWHSLAFSWCVIWALSSSIGGIFTLLCAILFSFHILYLDRIARHIPSALEFNLAQCFLDGIDGNCLLRLAQRRAS